jgi:hypothetical protein
LLSTARCRCGAEGHDSTCLVEQFNVHKSTYIGSIRPDDFIN